MTAVDLALAALAAMAMTTLLSRAADRWLKTPRERDEHERGDQ